MATGIDPKQLLLVRALWGDKEIASHEKVLWDISYRAAEYAAPLAGALTQVAVCYGKQNVEFARGCGYQVIEANDDVPPLYAQHRRTARSGRQGRIQGGVSMLWRKLDAIRVAFDALHPRSVLFLDWDVIVEKRPDAELLAMLEAGPEFQGRNQFAPKTTVPWRPEGRLRWTLYVGGCYYFRGRDLLDAAIQCHATKFPGDSDEMAVTYVVDQELGLDPAIDNERLYVSAMGMKKRGVDPYFRHGRLISLKRFAQIKAGDPWALNWLSKGKRASKGG
jgi:hypothetical protein